MSWGLEILSNLTTSLINVAGNVSLHGYDGLFAPAPLSSWRVTPDNPVRYPNSLDVERCAALHNELLWYGWNVPGGKAEDFPGVNWFDYHRNAAAEVKPRLSAPLTAFLERAHAINGSHSFLYHVGGLTSPLIMWQNHEGLQDFADRDRFLTLYIGHSIASHPDGLVYDQVKHKAIMQTSIHDFFTTQNGRQTWLPLETVLTAWLDMADVGKMQALPNGVETPYERFDPWIMVPYSDRQLNNTVAAFERLTEAIESRMPGQSVPGQQHVLPREPESAVALLSGNDLEAAGIVEGFAHSFLTTVRRPKFRYIAPGLSLPTPESVKMQPFRDVKRPSLMEEWDDTPTTPVELPPILLFPSAEMYETWRDPDPNPQFPDSRRPFNWPYNQHESYPAGLYFKDTYRRSMYPFEDSVQLVLPYPIGDRGYARKADGSRFGENTEEKGVAGYVKGGGTFADLFQLGYIPFGEMHNVQLEKVLDAWTALVESGEWRVGKDGVAENMRKWRDADTAKKWEKYVVPMSW